MLSSPPALISVDWGTSSFRAYLADAAGRTLEEIADATGALSFARGEHEAYLAGKLGEWRRRHPDLPIVASGMVGARQGWIEAPYVACPAGPQEIAAATIVKSAAALGEIRILPGVSYVDRRDAPDVIRGEESEILGALIGSGESEGLFVLPGTHSKWARVEGGRIVEFATYMTGEIFAILKTHSVLGRMIAQGSAQGVGFAMGLSAAAALEKPGDLLHAVFMTRTFGLFNKVAPEELGEYLSGVLIGAEVIAGARGAKRALVIGGAELAERYLRAGAALGVEFLRARERAATLGHVEVLRRLGLL